MVKSHRLEFFFNIRYNVPGTLARLGSGVNRTVAPRAPLGDFVESTCAGGLVGLRRRGGSLGTWKLVVSPRGCRRRPGSITWSSWLSTLKGILVTRNGSRNHGNGVPGKPVSARVSMPDRRKEWAIPLQIPPLSHISAQGAGKAPEIPRLQNGMSL